MFGFRKSPVEKQPTQTSADPMNPFDSDLETNNHKGKNAAPNPSRRTSSEPTLPIPDDDDDDYFGRGPTSLSAYKQKKELHSMSMQELEGYAVNQARETTKSVNNCLKIAVDIREDATRTLDTLHQQGEQIHRTHVMAADMERDLSKGEKLLNNLGGMFSMPWKPKKTKTITGPKTYKDDNERGKRSTQDQREKLGLSQGEKVKGSRSTPPEPTDAIQHIEHEKMKQDDALSDLGGILGELKGMAVDMGSELNRQNKALDDLEVDVDELNSRVKGANQRARRLVGK
ncbi:Putative SNAP25 homologous protein SNAP30 [Striga hermonthica]|uniref:SNAP25 homologous protein SNAP30 n=1 Tax=Striga hermonthica TaxID=68872 RepID=A0A9N7NDW6_STRHE|nr:Putative SNAP25 homologous protein SNAP30 [Striga hermonthica]